MKRCSAAIVLTLSCAELGAQTPETVNICSRTTQVQDRILAETSSDDVCNSVLTSELEAITNLYLRNRGINFLRSDDFSGLTGLQTLNIESNADFNAETQGLPRDVFSELVNLQTLDMTDLNLTSLPAGIFSNLTNLQTLDLASNRFTSLPANVFSGLTNLRTLDLIASFGIGFSLPTNIFSRLTNLRTLKLESSQNLLRLPATALSGLTNLQTLTLGDSGLTALPGNIFSGLTSLAEMYLDGNPGSDFNLWVRPKFEPLQPPGDPTRTRARLVLRKGAPRPITVAVSTAEGGTLSADSLTIPTGGVESSLVTITRASEDMPFELNLGAFTFGGDNKRYAGFRIAPGPPIDESIIDICERTEAVQAVILAAVDTDDCEIVPSSELMTITELNLTNPPGGGLSLRPGDFSELTRLQTLELSNNGLVTLPVNIFQGLINLQTLDLSNNRFQTLPADIFSELTSLQTLDIRNNLLGVAALPADIFSGLTSLRTLDIRNNSLTVLPSGIFSGLINLVGVNLHGNTDEPFRFVVRPEFELSDDSVSATVKLVLLEGAPRPITVALSTTEGATLSSDSLTIPTGRVESSIVTITRNPGSPPFELTLGTITLGGDNGQYTGIRIVTGEPTEGPTIDICDRTEAVREHILLATPTTDVCAAVLAAELMQIRGLSLNGLGISSLQPGDFSELTRLRDLVLSGNSLSSLPADIFSGLSNLLTLRLNGNSLSSLPANIFLGLTGLGDFSASVTLEYNPGAPFELAVRPEFGPTSALDGFTGTTVKLTLREGAPRNITVALSTARGTTVSADSLTIPAGAVESAVARITRTSSNVPFGLILGAITLGGDDPRYPGIRIVTGEPVGASPVHICGRTGRVQEGVLQATAADDTCDAVAASELASITRLSFSSSGILSLRRGDFSGLTGLRALNLEDNMLSTLPANVFSGLTELRTLDLTDNQLTTLTANVFAELTSLQTLNLADNQLSGLTADVFANLADLRTLSLADNMLNTLPAGIFSGSTGLLALNLENNDLGALPADVFSELTDLQTLDMSSNRLSVLPDNLFSELTGLRTLDLRDNDLGTLPDDVFSRLTSLRTLNLAGNQLTELPADVFTGLTGLAEMHLGGNPGLITLTVNARFDPPQLPRNSRNATVKLVLREGAPRPITVALSATGATLSTNSLTIPTGSVESNALVTITPSPGNVPFGLTLDPPTLGGSDDGYSGFNIVSGEAIIAVCGRTDAVETAILAAIAAADACETVPVPALAGITELNLANTGITSLQPDDFSGLTGLRTLDLRDNNLGMLPAGVFSGLTSLTEVHLSGNPGSSFTLTVRTRFNPRRLPNDFSSATVTLALREGAPRPITVEVTVTGATPESFSLTIPTGGVESNAFVEITRGDGTFELTLGSITLDGENDDYSGFEIVVPESPITISSGVRLRLKMFLEGALE